MMILRTVIHPWIVVNFVVVVTVTLSCVDGARDVEHNYYGGQESRPRRTQIISRHRRLRSEKPNIILIMTDDQDVLLGSLNAMPKLQDLMISKGASFNNSFTSTPMCCPSRSSTLTGLYVHNHNVYTNNDNCSSSQWQQEHEPRTFAKYLRSGNYRTGYFGKYLNKYDGSHVPEGWDKWMGLVRNSRFYNYTLNYQGSLIRHADNYYRDYLTDLIANDSVAFFKTSKRKDPSVPVMMMLTPPAPHGPEDAAPQYQHMFVNNTDHRTASWNMAPNMDKQWLLRQMQRLTPQYKLFTDLLQRRRLQTLQSVDDLVEKLHNELDMLDELDNTYIMFTSDHGYHLGQFGLVKGKSLAYDFDVRVPLVIRGPGIRPGTVIHNMAANVDLAPTILEMGGVNVPDHMDGTSLLPLLKATRDPDSMDNMGFVKTVKPWRDSILLERGKVSKKMIKDRMRKERLRIFSQSANQPNLHLYLAPKQQKVARECADSRNYLPCKVQQKWYCKLDSTGRLRLHKCRDPAYNGHTNSLQADEPQFCQCSDGRIGLRPSSVKNARRHRRFLKHHGKRKARGKLLRHRRSALQDMGYFGGAVQFGSSAGLNLMTRRCRILANNTVSCDQDIYRDYDQWQSHRERIDEMIKEYKKALDDLRNIREHLLEQRPPMYPDEAKNQNLDQDRDVVEDEDCECEPEAPLSGREEKRLQRHLRREQKKQQRMEARNKRRSRRGRKKKRGCDGRNMKCFSHDNDHWKTPPYWTFEDEIGGDQARGCPSLRLFRRYNYPTCYRQGMECGLMDNCHWKTPPFWSYGPFCFCSNANNNTYWCLRTVNQTHNFLYCEYITNFIAYYDMIKDPDQLTNVAMSLHYGVLQQLHEELATLKVCRGREDCNLHNHHPHHVLDSHLLNPFHFQDISGDGDFHDDEDMGHDGEGIDDGDDYGAYYDDSEQDDDYDVDFF